MKKLFNDISDFLYLRKIIKSATKEKEWKDLNLRHDWLYNPYTVVNLPPEVYEADLDVQMQFVMYFMQDVNVFFVSHLLQDMLIPSVEKIDGTASYLVVYYSEYRTLGAWFFTKLVLLAAAATFIWMKYDVKHILHRIVETVTNVIN